MDLKDILSSDLLEDIGKAAGGKVDTDKITQVIGAALPAILENNSSENTSATRSTSEKKGLSDTASALFSLLGDNSSNVTQSVSESTGVSQNQVTSILTSAAPFLLKLLGSNSSSNSSGANILSMVTGLLGDKDETDSKEDNSSILSMVTNLLGDKDEKDDKDEKKDSGTDALGSLVNLATSLLGDK